jgi:hypothetical protein
MADIKLNPKVANYIVEVDWPSVGKGTGPAYRDIVDHYESGNLILLRNVPLGVDYDLVNRITVPRLEGSRELSYKSFLYPKLWRRSQRRLMYGTFGLNAADYWRFRTEVRRLNARIAELTRQVFPSYRFIKEQFSWRFLPTDLGIHPLHIDSFGSNDDLQYVRFFTNLDRQPRVWRVSHRLHEVADRFYRRENWARHAALPANRFCEVASRICYEDPDPDCHEISFGQGDVWLCDTRKVSHGVVSGHRLMATHFWADPQTMQDPSKRLNQVVSDIHARHAAGDRRVMPMEGMVGA